MELSNQHIAALFHILLEAETLDAARHILRDNVGLVSADLVEGLVSLVDNNSDKRDLEKALRLEDRVGEVQFLADGLFTKTVILHRTSHLNATRKC